jgi:hypothetical protein
MCPACLASVASLAMLLSGAAATALLALKSKPLPHGVDHDHEAATDRLEE